MGKVRKVVLVVGKVVLALGKVEEATEDLMSRIPHRVSNCSALGSC